MSYDFQAKFKSEEFQSKEIIKEINKLSDIENSRFKLGDDYYMEIDLDYIPDSDEETEQVASANCISFHVPYAFMDKHDIDHEVYFDKIKEIAVIVNSRAIDLQNDTFIDTLEYHSIKRRQLITNIDSLYNSILLDDNKLLFYHNDIDRVPFTINLKNFNIGTEKVKYPKTEPSYIYEEYKFQMSNNGLLVAIYIRDEKLVKLYKIRGYHELGQEELEKLWNSEPYASLTRCGEISNLLFSSDDKYIISSADHAKNAKLWDAETGKLIRNFSLYGRFVADIFIVNEKLFCICSGAGITFYSIKTGKIIVNVTPFKDNWIVFNSNGDYEFLSKVNGAIELDWIDNANNESYCFIPDLGFAYYERWGSFKLNKLKETKGKEQAGLLKTLLEEYVY